MYKSQATDLHDNGGSLPIAEKVHKNPSVWATNKTLVATIIYSCINSTKGNC